MCRSIKNLFNFEPPVTDEEVRAAALQFVRKISGFQKPSHANQGAFMAAVEDIAAASKRLLRSLGTGAPPKNRGEEAAKAKARAAARGRRNPTANSRAVNPAADSRAANHAADSRAANPAAD